MCATAVESPENALLLCEASPQLTVIRSDFFNTIRTLRPDIARPADLGEAEATLKVMITAREITSLLAAFVRRTFMIFSSVELIWPAEYVQRVDESDEDTDVDVEVDDE